MKREPLFARRLWNFWKNKKRDFRKRGSFGITKLMIKLHILVWMGIFK